MYRTGWAACSQQSSSLNNRNTNSSSHLPVSTFVSLNQQPAALDFLICGNNNLQLRFCYNKYHNLAKTFNSKLYRFEWGSINHNILLWKTTTRDFPGGKHLHIYCSSFIRFVCFSATDGCDHLPLPDRLPHCRHALHLPLSLPWLPAPGRPLMVQLPGNQDQRCNLWGTFFSVPLFAITFLCWMQNWDC